MRGTHATFYHMAKAPFPTLSTCFPGVNLTRRKLSQTNFPSMTWCGPGSGSSKAAVAGCFARSSCPARRFSRIPQNKKERRIRCRGVRCRNSNGSEFREYQGSSGVLNFGFLGRAKLLEDVSHTRSGVCYPPAFLVRGKFRVEGAGCGGLRRNVSGS